MFFVQNISLETCRVRHCAHEFENRSKTTRPRFLYFNFALSDVSSQPNFLPTMSSAQICQRNKWKMWWCTHWKCLPHRWAKNINGALKNVRCCFVLDKIAARLALAENNNTSSTNAGLQIRHGISPVQNKTWYSAMEAEPKNLTVHPAPWVPVQKWTA